MDRLIKLQVSMKMSRFFQLKVFNRKDKKNNFDSFIKFPMMCFRIVTYDFNPLEDTATFRQKLVYHFKMNYFKLVLIALAMEIILFAMFGIVNSDDFSIFSVAVGNSLAVVLILLKAWTTFEHRNDIWEILQELKTIFGTHGNEKREYKIRAHLDYYNRLMKFSLSPYILGLCNIAFNWLPYLMFGQMSLVGHYWFPFDAFRYEIFPFILMWENWQAWTMVFVQTGADSLLCALISLTTMEFDILKIDMSDIDLVPENARLDFLQALTDRHNKLLSIADKIEATYSLTFLCSLLSLVQLVFHWFLYTGS